MTTYAITSGMMSGQDDWTRTIMLFPADEALKIVMRGAKEDGVTAAEDLVFRNAMRPTVERPV